ncbi:heme-degrading domain-containing protein [Peribacillus sp. NPDC058002]|uniref:heme-degrading domain-containing protein n=1 Tax=Peribacillus sp. NPDC058002 TaxID=3346301 RepID=UPI0036D945D6
MDHHKELLDILKRQEEELQFTSFTNEMAFELGSRLMDNARKANKSIVIDITRNSLQLFHFAMSGTSLDNDGWIKRKNNVVNRFGHSSYYMGIYYKSLSTTIKEKSFLSPEEYSSFGGSFPIIIKNVGMVGTIAVSGMTQEEDHNLIITVLQQLIPISE